MFKPYTKLEIVIARGSEQIRAAQEIGETHVIIIELKRAKNDGRYQSIVIVVIMCE
jgi:hypothetical protein